MARIQIPKIPWSEITPEEVFLNRRNFMKGAGLTLGTAALAACRMPETEEAASGGDAASTQPEALPADLGATDELGDPLNSFDQITNYNNYYEFSTDKQAVARLSEGYSTSPWTVEVGGLVNNPGTYDCRRPAPDVRHRRAHLPAALRGGLVDGDPLDGVPHLRPACCR